MGVRRPALVVLEAGELGAPRQLLQQCRYVGDVSTLQQSAGRQAQYMFAATARPPPPIFRVVPDVLQILERERETGSKLSKP